jgi:hypothetical protein
MIDNKFHTIIRLKFIFIVAEIIELICIYLSYEENVFAGLSIKAERLSKDFTTASTVYIVTNSRLLIGLSLYSLSTAFCFLIQISGFTYKFNRINIISKLR